MKLTLGSVAKNYRKNHALTQADMALKLCIDRATYNYIENDRFKGLSPRVIKGIAGLLGKEVEDIVKLTKEK